MSTQLKDYKLKKDALLESYQHWMDSALFPIADITPEQIQSLSQNLSHESFIIAVCGQMKAGKSSLLNALIFGYHVLPTDDTVMTAKITVISYAETPKLVATFYSESEWQALLKNYKESYQDPKMLENFNIELNKTFVKGYNYLDYIKAIPLEKTDTIENLSKYVAVVDRGGVLSPFVKSVQLYHQNENLKGVDIVDTPGINDPNIMRTKTTTDWICRADAVVYVSYAGQPLAEADKEFIYKHLGSVDETRKILVFNKIDLTKNLNEIVAYVKKLRASIDPEIKAIVADDQHTAFVSSGAALVKSARSLNRVDDKINDLEWVLEGSPYLDGTNSDGVPELDQMIATRLIENKGASILSSHENHFKDFKERIHNYFNDQFSLLEDEKKYINLSQTELIALQQNLNQIQQRIHAHMEKNSEKLDEKIDEINTELFIGKLDSAFSRISSAIDKEWQSKSINKKNCLLIFAQVARNEWNAHKSGLSDFFSELKNSIADVVKDIIDTIMQDLTDYKIEPDTIKKINSPKTYINVKKSIFKNLEDIQSKITLMIKEIDIESESSIWFKIFNAKSDHVKSAVFSIFHEKYEGLKEEFKASISDIYEGLANDIKTKIQAEIVASISPTGELIKNQIRSKSSDISELLAKLEIKKTELTLRHQRFLDLIQTKVNQ